MDISSSSEFANFTSTPSPMIVPSRNDDDDATMNDQMNSSRIMRLSYFYGTLPLILFCVVSLVINLKILMTVAWIRRPMSPTLLMSLSLAGADGFSSVSLAVGLVMNSFIPHGLGIELSSSGTGCFLLSLEAIRLGGIIVTVAHLVILAANHYCGIVEPLRYPTIMTHGTTTFLIILAWTLPMTLFFGYFVAVNGEGFQSRNCESNAFLLERKFRFMFGALFFGPFVPMICIYARIFSIVRKSQATRLRYGRGSDTRREQQRQSDASRQMARNVKAVNTTIFILGSYVVGWFPASFLYVLVCQDCPLKFDWITGELKFIVYNASNCLIILKTLANPIIYAARMHEIRIASERMRRWMCGARRRASESFALRDGKRCGQVSSFSTERGTPLLATRVDRRVRSRCVYSYDVRIKQLRGNTFV